MSAVPGARLVTLLINGIIPFCADEFTVVQSVEGGELSLYNAALLG